MGLEPIAQGHAAKHVFNKWEDLLFTQVWRWSIINVSKVLEQATGDKVQ